MSEIEKTENIIEINNLSFSYGRERALENISFNIHRGHYLGLIGPNGAGKTTLLKLILGILKTEEGTIKIYGQNIQDFRDWQKIGYVPQQNNFDPNFPVTVFEVVIMGRYARAGLLHGINEHDKKIAEDALTETKMFEHKDRLIGELSGGQRQRVFITRALVAEPEIMFLDEPTTGIDEKSRDEFYNLLRDLNQKKHMTLILVSHDVDRVIEEANHIACINKNLVCFESPGEFLRESHDIRPFHNHQK